MKKKIYTSSGAQEIDLLSYTIAQLISNGYENHLCGGLLFKRVYKDLLIDADPVETDSFNRIMSILTFGVIKCFKMQKWTNLRSIFDTHVTNGDLTQDDYDYLDGILPS